MEFNYIRRDSDVGRISAPVIPIILNGFPIGNAFIDTGADVTLLPMELNTALLHLELDFDKSIEMAGAGGGKFMAIPSKSKVTYTIDHSGFRPITWKGIVFFAPRQGTILLGQYQCLSELKITLNAPEGKLVIH